MSSFVNDLSRGGLIYATLHPSAPPPCLDYHYYFNHCIYQIHFDRTALHSSRILSSVSKSKQTWYSWILRVFHVVVFVGVSMTSNYFYIEAHEALSGAGLVMLQLALLLLNAVMKVIVPYLVTFVCRSGWIQSYGTVSLTATLLSLLDLGIPFIATLIRESRCFLQLFVGTDVITAEYSFSECAYRTDYGYCVYETTITNTYSFQPAFSYSFQCRNAVLEAYIPLVIFSSAFKAFIMPLVYFASIRKVDRLDRKFRVFTFTFSVREIVLPDLSYSLCIIWEDMMMLLSFGLTSPYAAGAIGINIISMVWLIRCSIVRYFRLQFLEKETSELRHVPQVIALI